MAVFLEYLTLASAKFYSSIYRYLKLKKIKPTQKITAIIIFEIRIQKLVLSGYMTFFCVYTHCSLIKKNLLCLLQSGLTTES